VSNSRSLTLWIGQVSPVATTQCFDVNSVSADWVWLQPRRPMLLLLVLLLVVVVVLLLLPFPSSGQPSL